MNTIIGATGGVGKPEEMDEIQAYKLDHYLG